MSLESRRLTSAKPGDTLVEVIFAFAVFSLVAVMGISTMNRGSEMAQNSLEINLVRNQINAQAEALRFLHESFIRQESKSGGSLLLVTPSAAEWNKIIGRLPVAPNHPIEAVTSLSEMIVDSQCNYPEEEPSPKAFILNPRDQGAPALDDEFPRVYTSVSKPLNFISNPKFISNPSSYARLVFGPDSSSVEDDTNIVSTNSTLRAVDGIWIERMDGVGYYDFYIRACWSSGASSVPNTLQTVVRLYAPN